MKPAEEIERLVRQALFQASPEMDEHLRADMARAGPVCPPTALAPNRKNPRRPIMRISIARIVVAALIGTGLVAAATVGVKYYYMGTDEEGRARVVSEDGRQMTILPTQYAGKPEEAVKRAEEMRRIIQQGERRLVSVHEVEVNGKLDSRRLYYEYTLDGRKAKRSEYDPETGPGTFVGEREKEADQLWHKILEGAWGDGHGGLHTAEGEAIPTYERVVQGRTFVLRKFQFVLSDGTKVALSWSSMAQQKDSQ